MNNPSHPPAALPPAWNPRYLAYCQARGETDPERMLERDRSNWPGGRMCGFMLWIRDRWHEWSQLHPEVDQDLRGLHGPEFDAWLTGRVEEPPQ